MAKRGPKPLPAKLLELRGSRWAAGRKLTDPGYTCPTIGPDADMSMPDYLVIDAKIQAIYDDVVARIRPLGVTGPMDVAMLQRYALELHQWKQLAAFAKAYGSVRHTRGKDGQVTSVIMAQTRARLAIGASLLAMEKELGLSPGARAGFGIALRNAGQEPKPETDKSRFFAS